MAHTPIRLSTLRPDRALTFDLYIFFREHYLVYIKSGLGIPKEKFGKLKKQKIAPFFLKDSDEANYQQYLDALLNESVADKNVSTNDKVDIVQGASQSAIEMMNRKPGDAGAYKLTQSAAQSIRNLVSQNEKILNSLCQKGSTENAQAIVQHSLNVSALVCKLGTALKLSEKELEELSVAALLHDIGLPKLNQEDQALIRKRKADLSAAHKKTLKQHTVMVKTLLADKPHINGSILELMMRHEENLNDTENRMTFNLPMQILSICNLFDERVTFQGDKPADIIKSMMIDEMGNYPLELLQALKGLLKSEGMT